MKPKSGTFNRIGRNGPGLQRCQKVAEIGRIFHLSHKRLKEKAEKRAVEWVKAYSSCSFQLRQIKIKSQSIHWSIKTR